MFGGTAWWLGLVCSWCGPHSHGSQWPLMPSTATWANKWGLRAAQHRDAHLVCAVCVHATGAATNCVWLGPRPDAPAYLQGADGSWHAQPPQSVCSTSSLVVRSTPLALPYMGATKLFLATYSAGSRSHPVAHCHDMVMPWRPGPWHSPARPVANPPPRPIL